MPLFNASQKVVSAVVYEIADAAGASADDEMRIRAGRSLNAAIQHFNNRANWDFVLTEAPPVTITGPFDVAVTASANEVSAALAVGHGVEVDDLIVGSPFRTGTRVSATAATSMGINYAINNYGAGTTSVSAQAIRDRYPIPTDWKAEYTVRLLGSQRVLHPIRRRQYDRTISGESNTSTPARYDVFFIGGKGKISLGLPPAALDILQMRYYRRMTTWGTATAVTSTLDIPEDYEGYQIAWAKWHFLTDKRDASEQAQTWLALAQEGIKTMLGDQTRRPDEDLMMIPGASFGAYDNPNSTQHLDYQYT